MQTCSADDEAKGYGQHITSTIRWIESDCGLPADTVKLTGAGGGGWGGIQHLKNASLSSCMLHATWQDMIESAEWETRFATGGLGKLMVPDLYEVWLCDSKHECAAPGDMMCFTFNEQGEYFEPPNEPLVELGEGPAQRGRRAAWAGAAWTGASWPMLHME